jgi:uncharacterized membrane protein
MSNDRLEAFSDGVIAILITITAVESRTPRAITWAALREGLQVLLAYLRSSRTSAGPRDRARP